VDEYFGDEEYNEKESEEGKIILSIDFPWLNK